MDQFIRRLGKFAAGFRKSAALPVAAMGLMVLPMFVVSRPSPVRGADEPNQRMLGEPSDNPPEGEAAPPKVEFHLAIFVSYGKNQLTFRNVTPGGGEGDKISMRASDDTEVMRTDGRGMKITDLEPGQRLEVRSLEHANGDHTVSFLLIRVPMAERIITYRGPITEIKDDIFTQLIEGVGGREQIPQRMYVLNLAVTKAPFKNYAQYHVDKETQFVIDGKPGTLKDLKRDQKVDVTFHARSEGGADWNNIALKVVSPVPASQPATQPQ